MEKIFQGKAKIITKEKTGPGFYKMTLGYKEIAHGAYPGQFVQIKIADSYEPFLRRPLGVHGVKGDTFEVLFEVAGKGTQILSEKKPGGYLDILGPLGKGFDYKPQGIGGKLPVLVAGGMGVAPLLFLAQKLAERKTPKAVVLIGSRTRQHVLCQKEFEKAGCRVIIATDDGSFGFKGYVSELLKIELLKADEQSSVIYACGPRLMLKEVSKIALIKSIPAQVSLEAHMACGIGACLGCVVNTKSGYQRVCKDGPVFDAGELVWDRE
jgi:dihydroorotate dehydrogenase electron transfer subunit